MSGGVHDHEQKVNPGESLDELCYERRNDFIQSTRDKMSSTSKAIEIKAVMMILERSHNDRPYGLPSYWSESGREQIWMIILQFIDEPEDVINLSETCVLFQCLLKDKYRAVRLAEAVEIGVTERDWMLPPKTLLGLRLASRSAKNFIDTRVMTGTLGADGMLEYLISGLSLKLFSTWNAQTRLHRILSSLEIRNVPIGTFPLRQVHIYERQVQQPFQDSVRKLFELVGDSIHSLVYSTNLSSHDAYDVLRGWAALLPNLEEVTVDIRPRNLTITDLAQPLEPFIVLPRLKRYWEEIYGGFSASHLGEILNANPTLQLVKLCKFPENRLDALMTDRVLDHHQLEMFGLDCHSAFSTVVGRQILWPLTKLYLWTDSTNPISAGSLFKFVNQFGATLKKLRVIVVLSNESNHESEDTTMLDLPNLVQLQWYLQNNHQPLRFMIPLKKLEHIDILLSERSALGTEEVLQHLERFHVPRLFPAMRRIRVQKRGQEFLEFETVWENGITMI